MLCSRINGRKLSSIISCYRRNFSCSRCLMLTHYEVLQLKSNCTPKEIRDSYLKLCKENHPDRDKNDNSLHKKFLRINEAYNVLSKPEARRIYDASIAYLDDSKKIKSQLYKDRYDTDEFERIFKDRAFYHNRREEFMNADPVAEDNYYGIKGIKRVSNGTLFIILLGFSFFCGLVQIVAIKNSLMTRERLRSQENAAILKEIKERANSRTEEEHLDEILKKYNENLEQLDIHYKKPETKE